MKQVDLIHEVKQLLDEVDYDREDAMLYIQEVANDCRVRLDTAINEMNEQIAAYNGTEV